MKINTVLYALLLLCLDFIVLVLALKIAIFIRKNLTLDIFPVFHPMIENNYFWILAIILMIFLFEKIYTQRCDFWGDTKKILKGLMLSFLAVFTVLTLANLSGQYSRVFIFIFFVIASLLIPFSKRVFKRLLFKLKIFRIKVKIIAKPSQYSTIYDEVKNNWYFGFENNEKKYDMVIISSKNFTILNLQKTIAKYTKKTKDIYIIPYVESLDLSHSSIIDYSNIRLSAIHIENKLLSSKNILTKYIFEKISVVLILPFILIAHVLIYILIKLDSDGSNIFKQQRLGKDSVLFDCYKYRTMYENNQQILEDYLKSNPDEVEYYAVYHKYKNDPRVTKVGRFLRKTSLDELPQFYNVLLGDMSLIGPRPYMLEEKEKIGDLNEELISKVKPGITGLWQVSGRNELTFKQRVNLDVWYIQNWSLWMDFVIFMKTIKVVLTKVGAK